MFAFSLDLPAEYLRVTAQKGDGIYAILRRYQLLDYSCNLNEF
ncbi:MAG: N-acetylmuramoyl-L-alanine amidase, partial [Neolewinella sp.]